MSLVAVGLVTCLATYAVRGYAFPVGADAPVYIWWIRLAGHEGLSAVGDRPGVPALALGLRALVPGGAGAVVAALEVALSMMLALIAAAWVRAEGYRRTAWIGAGVLTGAFALHLAVGYVATLLASVFVVAAIAVLSRPTKRAVVVAAGLLGVAGLAHPEFLVIGTAVLGLTMVVSPRGERGRIALTMVGGLAIAGAGMAIVSIGPPPIDIDTSRDDVLQRLGLAGMLPALFRQRLIDHAAVLVPLLTVPLAALGLYRSHGFLGRIVRSWIVVALVAGGVAFVTGVVPPERFVTFCFALPIAVALGIDTVAARIGGNTIHVGRTRSLLGYTVALTLFGAVAVGGLIVWFSTPPKLFPTEVARVTEASRYAAASSPGTPLVFSVSSGASTQSFFVPEAGNAIRSAVPPDRIRDVRVVIAPPFDTEASVDQEGRALVAFLQRQAFDAQPQSVWFDLAPFDRRAFNVPDPANSPGYAPSVVSQGVAIAGAHPSPVPDAVEPLEVASPLTIAGSTIIVLAVLTIVGLGWSMWFSGVNDVTAWALAPAFGAAFMIAGAVVADLVGIPMGSGWVVSISITLCAAGFGVRRWDARIPPA